MDETPYSDLEKLNGVFIIGRDTPLLETTDGIEGEERQANRVKNAEAESARHDLIQSAGLKQIPARISSGDGILTPKGEVVVQLMNIHGNLNVTLKTLKEFADAYKTTFPTFKGNILLGDLHARDSYENEYYNDDPFTLRTKSIDVDEEKGVWTNSEKAKVVLGDGLDFLRKLASGDFWDDVEFEAERIVSIIDNKVEQ